MLINGFEKSEIGSGVKARMFFNNPAPLKYKTIINGDEIEHEAPRSIVVEVSPSRDHHNIYTFSPTLMLDRKPISEDLRPMTKRLDLHEFAEWLPNIEMLFIIEAIRRGYGIEFDSGSHRKSQTPGKPVTSNTGDSRPA
jgi:hypothetical protein